MKIKGGTKQKFYCFVVCSLKQQSIEMGIVFRRSQTSISFIVFCLILLLLSPLPFLTLVTLSEASFSFALQQEFQMIHENLFRQTMNRISNVANIQQLARDCRKFINHHVFRGINLTPLELLSMFERLYQRYHRINRRCPQLSWLEQQKKIYQCFILAYSFQNSKKIKDLQNQEWEHISELFHNKSLLLLKYEAKIIERTQERVKWTEQEQQLLSACTTCVFHLNRVRQLKWADISRHIFFSSQGNYFKTPKQCRERWNNHMNQQINHEAWTIKEDIQILDSVAEQGRKWAKISLVLGSKRTEHMIKNRFNSLLTCARNLLKSKNRASFEESQLIKHIRLLLQEKQKKLASSLAKRSQKGQQMNRLKQNSDNQPQLLQSQNPHHEEKNLATIRSGIQSQLLEQEDQQNQAFSQEQAQIAQAGAPKPQGMTPRGTSVMATHVGNPVPALYPTAYQGVFPVLSVPPEAAYYISFPSSYYSYFPF